MELKGSFADRLPPEKREKMERTLRRMEEVRRNDDMRLGDIINAKYDWAIEEIKKGHKVIEDLDKQIKEIEKKKEGVRLQLLKLDGVVLALKDVSEEADKMAKEEAAAKALAAKKAAEEAAAKAAEEEKSKKKTTRKRTTRKTKKTE
jgi:membrane protein involved in colicin uptake